MILFFTQYDGLISSWSAELILNEDRKGPHSVTIRTKGDAGVNRKTFRFKGGANLWGWLAPAWEELAGYPITRSEKADVFESLLGELPEVALQFAAAEVRSWLDEPLSSLPVRPDIERILSSKIVWQKPELRGPSFARGMWHSLRSSAARKFLREHLAAGAGLPAGPFVFTFTYGPKESGADVVAPSGMRGSDQAAFSLPAGAYDDAEREVRRINDVLHRVMFRLNQSGESQIIIDTRFRTLDEALTAYKSEEPKLLKEFEEAICAEILKERAQSVRIEMMLLPQSPAGQLSENYGLVLEWRPGGHRFGELVEFKVASILE